MTTAEPLITVGIPFWNEERLLAAAIRSVLAQTWTNLEVLLVDDGSTDRSLSIAERFRDDARVTVISDGQRRHLPARLNEIVRRARGDLVARMDADDVVHPDRLRRQIAALDGAGPECAAAGTWAGLVDEDDAPFAVIEASAPARPSVAIERGVFPHATMLARRAWLSAYPYDEALTRAEDRDLWCRVGDRTKLVVVPEPLYVVRVVTRQEAFLSDYVESQRQNRLLFARYGPEAVGLWRTSRLWLESLAKAVVMRGAVRVGVADRIVRRRGRPPTAREVAQIAEALASGRQRP